MALLKSNFSRIGILILLIVLSFILGGCEQEILSSSLELDDCRTITSSVPFWTNADGNSICKSAHDGSYRCVNEPPPRCLSWWSWSNPECGAPDCDSNFRGVEVEVTCCKPAPGGGDGTPSNGGGTADGGTPGNGTDDDVPGGNESQITNLTCEDLNNPFEFGLEPNDATWECCVGEVIQDGNVTCCDGELTDIFGAWSEPVMSDLLGEEVLYKYSADAVGPYFVSCVGESEAGECGTLGRSGSTENDNEYSFSIIDGNEILEWEEKLLFCEAQCNVLVGDDVDEAVKSGECDVVPLISTAGEPPEYIDCQEEYEEGFICYTRDEWVNAGRPEPKYEVALGCDTSGEGGYCAPLVDTEEFVRGYGSDPGRCEFAELNWLTPSGDETEGVFGSGIGYRQGGTGSQQPGEEVILFAKMDLDCNENNDIKFDLKEVRGRGPYHLEYINANLIFEDGLVWARKTLEWTNWELVFQGVQNPQFRFNLVSDGVPSRLSPILTVSRPTEECGDGLVDDVEEECDDGDLVGGDGCNATCGIEEGWSCAGEPSVCNDVCGNGITEENYGEECDLGDENSARGECSTHCELTYCGDGVEQTPNGHGLQEECDDGNENSNDGCTDSCRDAKCGDGVLWKEDGGDEECDDGDGVGGDGCDASCEIEDGWTCDVTEDPSECEEIPAEPCHIFNAVWRDESFNELSSGAHVVGTALEDGYASGDLVYLSVEGDDNCRSARATFTIYEDDIGGETEEDIYAIIEGVEFFRGNTIIVAFEGYYPEWFDENDPLGDDDPDYYFVVESPSSNDEPLTSGKLNVDEPRLSQCNDGRDNDGDGLRDLNDPGCADTNDDYEGDATSECQDGVDNDNDNLIDWDGGRNAQGQWVERDPGCCDNYNGCDVRDNSENSDGLWGTG
ncbi:MAG: hypothetical protein ABIB47_02755 [Candidatus Woesearchaeota archaeon]